MFVAKLLFVCAAVVLVSGSPQGLGGFGAPRELSGNEIETSRVTLEKSLNTLAAGEGPHYRLNKILKAKTQVVAGSLDTYTVELIDNDNVTKTCEVKIWTRSWIPNGVEVTFDCPNEPSVIRTHSS